MKKLIRGVIILLVMATLLGILPGCDKGTAVIPGSYDETTVLAEAPTKIDISDYTINNGADCSEEANARSLKFKKAVSAFTDIDLKTSENTSKIISFRLSGDAKDWKIDFNESAEVITIQGGSSEALAKASNSFLLSASATSSKNKLIINNNIGYNYTYTTSKIDNSSLISYDASDMTWVDSLVMVELKIDSASIGGTFKDSYDLLDFYAEIGVNGIWLCPIYERGPGGNGYGNVGPHSVEPSLTGTDDYAKGWQVVKEFVDYAHSKGIYIFLDVISWGVMKNTELTVSHPDWFDGEAWGNAAFNWQNKEFVNWYIDTLVNNILVTGADGYRCDCEPNYAGYKVFGKIRKNIEATGKKVLIIAEDGITSRDVYDFEQDGVLNYSYVSRGGLYNNPVSFYANEDIMNIVDSVKNGTGLGHEALQKNELLSGTFKYYTNCVTNHDYVRRLVKGNILNIGYSAILAPFIPLWYMGDEFNTSADGGCLYNINVDYSEADDVDNALFLEDVKKLIEIRRTYSGIFEYWPDNHRLTNICKVTVEKMNNLQSYARYAGNKAVIVVPNGSKNIYSGIVHIPFDEMGMDSYSKYQITDLYTGRVILQGTKEELQTFNACVAYKEIGLYLLEGIR